MDIRRFQQITERFPSIAAVFAAGALAAGAAGCGGRSSEAVTSSAPPIERPAEQLNPKSPTAGLLANEIDSIAKLTGDNRTELAALSLESSVELPNGKAIKFLVAKNAQPVFDVERFDRVASAINNFISSSDEHTIFYPLDSEQQSVIDYHVEAGPPKDIYIISGLSESSQFPDAFTFSDEDIHVVYARDTDDEAYPPTIYDEDTFNITYRALIAAVRPKVQASFRGSIFKAMRKHFSPEQINKLTKNETARKQSVRDFILVSVARAISHIAENQPHDMYETFVSSQLATESRNILPVGIVFPGDYIMLGGQISSKPARPADIS